MGVGGRGLLISWWRKREAARHGTAASDLGSPTATPSWTASSTGCPAAGGAGAASLLPRQGRPQACPPASHPPPPESRGSGARIALRAGGIRGSNPIRPPAAGIESGRAQAFIPSRSPPLSFLVFVCSAAAVSRRSRVEGGGRKKRRIGVGALHREEERKRGTGEETGQRTPGVGHI